MVMGTNLKWLQSIHAGVSFGYPQLSQDSGSTIIVWKRERANLSHLAKLPYKDLFLINPKGRASLDRCGLRCPATCLDSSKSGTSMIHTVDGRNPLRTT